MGNGWGSMTGNVMGAKADGTLRGRNGLVVQRKMRLGEGSTNTNRTGLPENLKAGIENLSGYSMDDVRVHYNSPEPSKMNALAYTRGTEIHIARGQEKHLPHEGWHVVQQMQGRVKPTVHICNEDINADISLEKEADVMGSQALHARTNIFAEQPLKTQEWQITSHKNAIQLKGEFKHAYEQDEKHAVEVVRARKEEYLKYAQEFEEKLGAGLFNDERAKEGAREILKKIKKLIEKYGTAKRTLKEWLLGKMMSQPARRAFAQKTGGKAELGGLNVEDVEVAMRDGNLRELMGMVYQARSAIFSHLAKKYMRSGKAEKIKDETLQQEVLDIVNTPEIDEESFMKALGKRRDSVARQDREWRKRGDSALTISSEELEKRGVPLSEREKRRAGDQKLFAPGSAYYEVGEKQREEEEGELRRVVAGLSGSTDMYFKQAKLLGINSRESLQRLRLAALGQMITNGDHSYHEVMHEAKTRGGLSDYPDKLPIGYTTLEPLTENKILEVAGEKEFPGDREISESGTWLDPAFRAGEEDQKLDWKEYEQKEVSSIRKEYWKSFRDATNWLQGVDKIPTATKEAILEILALRVYINAREAPKFKEVEIIEEKEDSLSSNLTDNELRLLLINLGCSEGKWRERFDNASTDYSIALSKYRLRGHAESSAKDELHRQISSLDESAWRAYIPQDRKDGEDKDGSKALRPREVEAINLYAQDRVYLGINSEIEKVITGKSTKSSLSPLINLIVSGLRKLPAYTGETYRGDFAVNNKAKDESEEWGKVRSLNAHDRRRWMEEVVMQPGQTHIPHGLWSTAKSGIGSYIGKSDNGGEPRATAYIIRGRSGRDITSVAGKVEEGEVLFPPGVRFKVVSVTDYFGQHKFGENEAGMDEKGERHPLAPKRGPGLLEIKLEEI